MKNRMRRKILIPFFTLFAGSMVVTAQSNQDLIWRLNRLSPDAYVKSMQHWQQANSVQISEKEWNKALKELTADKEVLLKGLKEANPKTIGRVKSLFSVLDKAMLNNPVVKEKQFIVLSRTLNDRARVAMGREAGLAPSNFQNNSEIKDPAKGWDNEFVVLNVDGGKVKTETLFRPEGKTIMNDPELHFDGKRLMYSSIGTNNRWHLFELDLATRTSRQITPEAYKDFDSFDGCYLPDGRVIFCATATFLGLPCTDGGNKMCGLFQYDPTTGKTRQLTFDQDSNWDPVMLENGKVMYQRWEYADLAHSNSRIIFTMNPDGTEQKAFYGSNSYFPTALFCGKPVPGKPSQFVGVVGGHHSTTRSGRMMLFDTNVGRKEADGVIGEFPYFGKKVVPIVRDRLPDGVWPHFLHPEPLDDKYFITVMKPSPNSLWGIYLVDVFNNVSLIYEEEGKALLNPVKWEKKNMPPVIPDKINLNTDEATVFIQNIYEGEGLKGLPKGVVKKLRIGSYTFSPHGQGGLLGTIGMDGPWDVKKIEGTVDVEADGSAMFKIPANTPIFIQPLDEEGKALQVMRSWLTGMPGETVSCIGCHEDQRTIPLPRTSIASKKKPQTITPFYGQERGFAFNYEIQPVLDKYCVQCHNGSTPDRIYLKGDKMITDWSSKIGGRVWDTAFGGKFSLSYANLHRFVRRPGIESDLDILVPMDVHADQTELMQMLNKGHHGVVLDREATDKLACWIDFNAPYYGRRKDIPEPGNENKRKTLNRGYEMRKLYAEMFGVKDRESTWEPDTTRTIELVRPVKLEVDRGLDSLKAWPLQSPEKSQLAVGQYQKTIELDNGVLLHLIKVPKGKFIMGSDRHPDEQPRTAVEIADTYWIGRFEITNEQYALFDPKHDSRTEHRHGYQFGRKGYPLNEDNQPVVRISWDEANAFCKWLTEKTGMNFSLPTEAQWEWACRGGSDKAFSFGDLDADFSNHANLGDIKLRDFAACTSFKNYESARILPNPGKYDDWIPRDVRFNDGGFVSESVGRYRANLWDIHDMHGNVWEWTRSAYRPYPYNEEDGRNDSELSDKRVVRGGSWYDRPFRATSTFRLPYRPYQKVYNVGFRVVMTE